MTKFDQLTTKLQADPAAAQAIAAEFGNPDKVKAALLRFAQDNAIEISEAELAAGLAEQSVAAGGALSDGQLAQVAGGAVLDSVMLSIFTLGIGCIVASAVAQSRERSRCGDVMSGKKPFEDIST